MTTPGWRRYLPRIRPDLRADVDDEFAFHVEMLVQELVAKGVHPAAARVEAVRRFGAVPPVRDACLTIDQRRQRRSARVDLMNGMLHDLRYALRTIRMTPGFSLIVSATLALGIGATTAMFSVVDGVLLRPLPYQDPSGLVAIRNADRTGGSNPISYPQYLDWKQRGGAVFTDIVTWYSTRVTFSTAGEPQILSGDAVSAGAASLLGVHPLLGRAFLPEEEVVGTPRVIMLGERLWRERFGARADVLGTTMMLNGNPFTIVGVLPSSERTRMPGDLSGSQVPEFWVPIRLSPANAPRGLNFLTAIGRFKKGMSPTQAAPRVTAIGAALNKELGSTNSITLIPLSTFVAGDTGRPLAILLAAVGMLLLIACANVANLLLAQAAIRERELGIRVALGAGRGRLLGQLLSEAVVRGILGGIAGIGVAYGCLWLVRRHLVVSLPRFDVVAIDGRVLLFAAVVALVSGLVFGIAPALRAVRGDPNSVLRDGGRGFTGSVRKDRLRRTLIVTEVALSFVLLVSAGLLIRTLDQLLAVKKGFDPNHVMTAVVELPKSRYPDSMATLAFQSRLLTEVRSIPGVEGAALASELPSEGGTNGGIKIEGQTFPDDAAPNVEKRIVSAGYFETMKARLASGRTFDGRDVEGAPPVVIVNQSFVDHWFHGQVAIGRRVDFNWDTQGWQTIVGIVADLREGSIDGAPRPAMYIPAEQHAIGGAVLVARSANDVDAVAAQVRARLRAIDPQLPLQRVKPLTEIVGSGVTKQRLSASILGVFAAVALLLAAVGLYGVISYSVTQRSQELGIRAALGASRTELLRLVMGQGLRFAAIGIALGAVLALASTRIIASQLYGVKASDAATFVVVGAVLAIVAAVATLIPAYRATRADPLSAIRGS